MNNWQNWAVALILLLCIVRIGQSIYSFFRGVKEKRNPCANCATGCELKNLYEKKRSECSEERKETKKKCCGQLVVPKNVLPLHPQTRKTGSLDEWLSQRSAKPCTAVRIRQEPQKKLRNHKTGFGAFSFYLLNLNLLFTLNYADRIP